MPDWVGSARGSLPWVDDSCVCSANIKAHSHETLLRTKDYKNLVKQQERDVRRLRRQLHTYEALATTQREAAANQSQTVHETMSVIRDTEIKAVTQETMKRLWDQDEASRARLSELESELASTKEHNKVCNCAEKLQTLIRRYAMQYFGLSSLLVPGRSVAKCNPWFSGSVYAASGDALQHRAFRIRECITDRGYVVTSKTCRSLRGVWRKGTRRQAP